MKWAVIGIAVAAGLLLFASWVSGRSSNPDTSSSAFIPQLLGLALLGIDVFLLVGWGIARLMFID